MDDPSVVPRMNRSIYMVEWKCRMHDPSGFPYHGVILVAGTSIIYMYYRYARMHVDE